MRGRRSSQVTRRRLGWGYNISPVSEQAGAGPACSRERSLRDKLLEADTVPNKLPKEAKVERAPMKGGVCK